MPPAPDLDDSAATNRRRPASWLLAAAVALLTVGLSVGLIAATSGNASDPDPIEPTERASAARQAPAVAPTPTAAPDPEVESGLTVDTAVGVLNRFLDGVAAATVAPESGLTALNGLASGAILAELEADRLQLADNGWTRAGTERVVSVDVASAELDATPATATVSACIDSSDVVLLDAEDKPIPSGTTPKRSINVYTLTVEGGRWLVANRTFPDEASC